MAPVTSSRPLETAREHNLKRRAAVPNARPRAEAGHHTNSCTRKIGQLPELDRIAF